MNFDRFYRIDRDGFYSLHFLNTNKHSVEQIREIFSSYGEVLTVNVSGDDYGLRFVKYKTLDETIACLNGLQNSNLIRLLPERFKNGIASKRMEKNESNDRQKIKKENSSPAVFNMNKLFANFHDTSLKVVEKSSADLKASDQDNKSDKVHTHLNINSQNTMHNNKHRTNISSSEKSNLPDFNIQHSSSSGQQNFINKNSSNTMDFEKYYRITKDACYSIHFLNKKGLTSQEIMELFSSYGNVLNTYDNNGFVFIIYKTVTETINCLKGLQTNNMVNILPQKVKISGTNKRTNQNGSQETSTNKTRINSNSSYNKTSSEAENRSFFDMKTSNSGNKFDKVNASSINNSPNSKHGSINNVNIKDDKSTLASSEKHASSLRQENFVNDKVDYNRMERQSDTCSPFSIKPDSYTDDNMCDENKIPVLISNKRLKQSDDDASNSSLLSECDNGLPKTIILPMQEIIVANIPVDYGMYYILHLFEKYNPIAATPVETIFETDIRYCYIYFESVQDATAVEKEFDNFVLSGKNLIVLRKLQLLKEAKSK